MMLSELEIVGKFRRADNKKEIMRILTELNACDEDAIRAILIKNGISEDNIPARKIERLPSKTRIKQMKKTDDKENETITKSETKQENESKAHRTIAEIEADDYETLTEEEKTRLERVKNIPSFVYNLVTIEVINLEEEIANLIRKHDELRSYLEGEYDGSKK